MVSPANNGLAPYSSESEEAVLGACIVNPVEFLKLRGSLKAEDFYLTRHALIWEAMGHVADQKLAIDYGTVLADLNNSKRLNEIGGPGYLLHLTSVPMNSMHASSYGEFVRRLAVRRRGLIAADEIKALFNDTELSLEEVLTDSEKRFREVRNGALRQRRNSMSEISDTWMDGVEERMRNPGKLLGISSGLRDFDKLTCGFIKGDLVIIGARPGAGKTGLMMNFVLHAAKAGKRVGVREMEMSDQDLMLRLVGIEADVNLTAPRAGTLTPEEYQRVRKAKQTIRELPIFVDDNPEGTPLEVASTASEWAYTTGLDLLIVDYLQLMTGSNDFRFKDRREVEVNMIARELKRLARELQIPIIAGAQLNRSSDKREDKRPQITDLRESGGIENAADLVHLLYREVEYNPATEHPNAMEIITSKHRNGAKGTTMIYFNPQSNRASNAMIKEFNLNDLSLTGSPIKESVYSKTQRENATKRAAKSSKDAKAQASGERSHDDDETKETSDGDA